VLPRHTHPLSALHISLSCPAPPPVALSSASVAQREDAEKRTLLASPHNSQSTQLPCTSHQSDVTFLSFSLSLSRLTRRASSFLGYRAVTSKVPLLSDSLRPAFSFLFSSPVHPRSLDPSSNSKILFDVCACVLLRKVCLEEEIEEIKRIK
jgi:hypothetical protein